MLGQLIKENTVAIAVVTDVRTDENGNVITVETVDKDRPITIMRFDCKSGKLIESLF